MNSILAYHQSSIFGRAQLTKCLNHVNISFQFHAFIKSNKYFFNQLILKIMVKIVHCVERKEMENLLKKDKI